jgi:site-specific DNA recombinase
VPGAIPVGHPPTVYVREDQLVPKVDEWIGTLFSPANVEQTVAAMVAAPSESVTDGLLRESAIRALKAAELKVTQHRRAVEAGGDPAMFVQWINEALAEVAEHRAVLTQAPAPAGNGSETEIRALVAAVADPVRMIASAAVADKADLYEALGLRLVLDPLEHVVTVEVAPCAKTSVRGGT